MSGPSCEGPLPDNIPRTPVSIGFGHDREGFVFMTITGKNGAVSVVRLSARTLGDAQAEVRNLGMLIGYAEARVPKPQVRLSEPWRVQGTR